MKPVEFVSIGGYVFSLEEDACSVAKGYLEELTSFYSKEESGAEVMEGIEERMSELLLEQCGKGGVVTLPMVNSVIETLGRPEAIEEEPLNDSAPSQGEQPQKNEEKIKRKLYRDPSDGKVAGVCSGLGAYFKVDPTLFRVLFVIFTLLGLGLGFGLSFHNGFWMHRPGLITVPVIYLILWICMPEAKTVRQRDEMHGEKGTVDAISARIQSTVNEMGEVADSVVHSDFWGSISRIFEVCLGIIFLVAGVAGVVSLGCLTMGDGFLYNTFIFNRTLEQIASDAPWMMELLSYPPLVAALAVTIVLPFIGLIYAGVMLLFHLKAPKWHPGLCIFVLWLIALTVLAVFTVMFLFKGSL